MPAIAAPDGAAPDMQAPVPQIDPVAMVSIGATLLNRFRVYENDRLLVEQRWMKNLRQYLGIYDPEIEQKLHVSRSKAYPKVTRVKVISVLARIMNLMFPGNERNWELKASPSADMEPGDVMLAVRAAVAKQQEAGVPLQITDEVIREATQQLAQERADMLARLIDDQLQEIGGDQTADYVALNHMTALSGILYGVGIVRGPMVRAIPRVTWQLDPLTQAPVPVPSTEYRPLFEHLPVWDFYPDMTAKNLTQMDGYFVRLVMSRAQIRDLGRREDFLKAQILTLLEQKPTGNYTPKTFETELRQMGIKANVNEQRPDTGRYEVLVWHGTMSGQELQQCGVAVSSEQLQDDLEAEVWMVDGTIIKAEINAWRRIGVSMRTVHAFVFDEDDTSPLGTGLPSVLRDSQMSIAAATRMLLDNASVTCGPNIEVNIDLMAPGQDVSGIQAYKVWEREGTGPEAQYPAVRNVQIDAHMPELLKIIDTFMRFADMETFVGPATGGDMERGMSEPMRTAAGASMMRGDAALPFKDIVRRYDRFTQSFITSLVQFNRKFNSAKAPPGDFNVIARGATSLIAKEVRGIQIDTLAATLTPEERIHVDERKLVEQRFLVRDLGDLLVPADEAKRRQAAASQQAEEQAALQRAMIEAETRKTLADAYKGIAQGQKNAANADASTAKTALDVLSAGQEPETPTKGAAA
jgi:hypothetical protein